MDSAINPKSKQTRPGPSQRESSILSTIVEAMLEAEAELQEASVDKWTRVLIEACRNRKGEVAARHVPNMAA